MKLYILTLYIPYINVVLTLNLLLHSFLILLQYNEWEVLTDIVGLFLGSSVCENVVNI